VNKARLIEKIAELVKEKKLEGISELRDESDKDGMRISSRSSAASRRCGAQQPLPADPDADACSASTWWRWSTASRKLLNLKDMLEAFVRHRREVVTRRTIFDLRKARARAHILEGLTVALANIDEMIELIKTSPSPHEAKERMLARTWEPGMVGALLSPRARMLASGRSAAGTRPACDGGYQLSEIQAKEILEMRLHRLTGLEQDKLTDEYKALLDTIRGLIEILEIPIVLLDVIRTELLNVKEEFGDERRSEIRTVRKTSTSST
jgi:DNA gyrase subunit A